MFDHRRAAEDDTADLGQPIPHELADEHQPHHPDDTVDSPGDRDAGLRPTRRARHLRTLGWLAAYTTTCLGSLWLLGLAFLHANPVVMLLATAALLWFAPATTRLARRLHTPDHAAAARPALRLPRTQRLAACVLTVTYLWLAVDWLAWTLRH